MRREGLEAFNRREEPIRIERRKMFRGDMYREATETPKSQEALPIKRRGEEKKRVTMSK